MLNSYKSAIKKIGSKKIINNFFLDHDLNQTTLIVHVRNLSNRARDLLEFVIIHTKSISKSVMHIECRVDSLLRSVGWSIVLKCIDIFPFVSQNVPNL